MPWLPGLSWFFGGAALANALPHVVNGVSGRPFQTPFATPPGQGFSSSTVNVLWGFFNLAIGYGLLCHVGAFDLRALDNAVLPLSGALLSGLLMARHFGRFHHGNAPDAK